MGVGPVPDKTRSRHSRRPHSRCRWTGEISLGTRLNGVNGARLIEQVRQEDAGREDWATIPLGATSRHVPEDGRPRISAQRIP